MLALAPAGKVRCRSYEGPQQIRVESARGFQLVSTIPEPAKGLFGRPQREIP
jgi:hypothetical protein